MQHRLKPSSASPQSLGQVHVLLHNCNSFRMDSTQIGILEQTQQEDLCCFLQGQDGCRLEANLLINYDTTNNSLEWKSLDEETIILLILFDLSHCHRPWSESSLSYLNLLLAFFLSCYLSRSFSGERLCTVVSLIELKQISACAFLLSLTFIDSWDLKHCILCRRSLKPHSIGSSQLNSCIENI